MSTQNTRQRTLTGRTIQEDTADADEPATVAELKAEGHYEPAEALVAAFSDGDPDEEEVIAEARKLKTEIDSGAREDITPSHDPRAGQLGGSLLI